jgi:hypothetical protein
VPERYASTTFMTIEEADGDDAVCGIMMTNYFIVC